MKINSICKIAFALPKAGEIGRLQIWLLTSKLECFSRDNWPRGIPYTEGEKEIEKVTRKLIMIILNCF